MMAPAKVNFLTTFIGDGFSNPQSRFAARKRQVLYQMKRSADSPDLELDLNFGCSVYGYRIRPWQQKDFAMLADVGPLVRRSSPAIGEHLLPAAFIVVELGARGTGRRRRINRHRAEPQWGSPNELDVTGLVEEFVDVGSLVGNNHDSEQFVFER